MIEKCRMERVISIVWRKLVKDPVKSLCFYSPLRIDNRRRQGNKTLPCQTRILSGQFPTDNFNDAEVSERNVLAS